MGSLNLCCHRALPNARLLPCSSAINNIITIKPHLLSSSSSSSTFNHHRHFCNSPTAVASTAKQLTSPELVALEYADLNLNYDNVSQVMFELQHVNPFAPSFSVCIMHFQLHVFFDKHNSLKRQKNLNVYRTQAFKDSTLPLMVDIGSGSSSLLVICTVFEL
ncbi:hypothetical protein AAG906_039145 [Vitis piasezkii]